MLRSKNTLIPIFILLVTLAWPNGGEEFVNQLFTSISTILNNPIHPQENQYLIYKNLLKFLSTEDNSELINKMTLQIGQSLINENYVGVSAEVIIQMEKDIFQQLSIETIKLNNDLLLKYYLDGTEVQIGNLLPQIIEVGAFDLSIFYTTDLCRIENNFRIVKHPETKAIIEASLRSNVFSESEEDECFNIFPSAERKFIN